MVFLHVFRNVLLANQDSESVVPDIQQLSDLTEIGNNFCCSHKNFMESLGPVPESCLWKATFLEESPHNIFYLHRLISVSHVIRHSKHITLLLQQCAYLECNISFEANIAM